MSDEIIHQAQEPHHVRRLRVRVEGRLVDPFRVKVIDRRIAYRLIEMDSHAARLRAGGFEKPHELFSQLRPLSGSRLESDKRVERQVHLLVGGRRDWSCMSTLR